MQDAGNNPVMNVDASGLLFELSDITRLLPSIPQPVYDFSMGLSNGVSFGLAQPISNWANGYSTANVDSQIYKVGEYSSLFASAGGAAVKATITGMREAAVSANAISNSTKFVMPEWSVTVGRWKSGKELGAMQKTGMAQESITGTTHVALPANANAFMKQARPSSMYVEFTVPSSSVKVTNQSEGWAKILGPNTTEARLAQRKGEAIPQMPSASCIVVIMCKFR